MLARRKQQAGPGCHLTGKTRRSAPAMAPAGLHPPGVRRRQDRRVYGRDASSRTHRREGSRSHVSILTRRFTCLRPDRWTFWLRVCIRCEPAGVPSRVQSVRCSGRRRRRGAHRGASVATGGAHPRGALASSPTSAAARVKCRCRAPLAAHVAGCEARRMLTQMRDVSRLPSPGARACSRSHE